MTHPSFLPPWIRYRETGLYAVPSTHGRLAFAQAVHEACRLRPFDVIAVELPAAFMHLGVTEKIRALGDQTGLIVIPDGRTVAVSAPPVGDPDGPVELRIAERGQLVPVTGCDSIITALRMPEVLQYRWPQWQPEFVYVDADPVLDDDRPRSNARKPINLGDDYLVNRDGLPDYYHRIEPMIQSLRTTRDRQREAIMAARLQRLLVTGKTILFVGGSAHMKNIFELLDQGFGPASPEDSSNPPPRLQPAVAVSLDASVAWAASFMDDAPNLVWQWLEHCKSKADTRFDKAAAVDRLLEKGTPGNCRAVSVRAVLNWRQYLFARLTTQGRFIPKLDSDLIHSARACVGRDFAEQLRELAMDYPPNAGKAETMLIPQEDGTLLVGCRSADGGNDCYYLVELGLRWTTGDSEDAGIPIYRRLNPKLSDRERQELKERGFLRVPAPPEQELAQRLGDHARQVAHARLEKSSMFFRRFAGDLGAGLDARRSIRAMMRGQGLQVRHRKLNRSGQVCDDRCPQVWIWEENARIKLEQSGYVPWTPPGGGTENVYSAFYWFMRRNPIGGTEVIRSTTAYSLHLLREMRPFQREKYQQLIATLPERRRCRVTPWSDREFRHFKGSQLAVAAAIKYAGDHVIIVSANPEWRPAPSVTDYASERRVKLIVLSTDEFDAAALKRHQVDHEVPAPGVFEPPFDFALKYVEPVEV